MFTHRVHDLFEQLFHCLEHIEHTGCGDVDEQDGVIRLRVKGVPSLYIIHSHQTLEQIWVSSPISGGLHFTFDAAQNKWYDTRNHQELITLLAQELTPYLPQAVWQSCFSGHA